MARGKKNTNGNGKQFTSQQSVNSAIKSICDIMRRSNCAGAMQYVPELTWILFLRILDETEIREADEHEALGIEFKPSLSVPFRWQDWAAAPFNEKITVSQNGHRQGWRRKELNDGPMGDYFRFANQDLIPHLRGLKDKPNAAPR